MLEVRVRSLERGSLVQDPAGARPLPRVKCYRMGAGAVGFPAGAAWPCWGWVKPLEKKKTVVVNSTSIPRRGKFREAESRTEVTRG